MSLPSINVLVIPTYSSILTICLILTLNNLMLNVLNAKCGPWTLNKPDIKCGP
jgi:hypothetical protein